jgi:hypothetical protein
MRVQCTFWSQIVSQSGSPPPHAHSMSDWLCTRLRFLCCTTTTCYKIWTSNSFCSLSLSLSLSHKTNFHAVFGPKIWALTLSYASRHDLLNSPDPTHSVLMIATNQNANANWRWRKKIILEEKDWRSIFANYETRSARYNDMHAHILHMLFPLVQVINGDKRF